MNISGPQLDIEPRHRPSLYIDFGSVDFGIRILQALDRRGTIWIGLEAEDLKVAIVVIEPGKIQAQPTIKKIAFHTNLEGVDRLRIHLVELDAAEQRTSVISARTHASRIARISIDGRRSLISQRQTPGRLFQGRHRARRQVDNAVARN